MSAYASQLVPFVLGVTVGFVVGALTAWLTMRGRTIAHPADQTTDQQIEIARMKERISTLTAESTVNRDKLIVWENKVTDLNSDLNVVRDERARFGERATRVPLLESQLVDLSAENQQLTQRLSDLRETLASSTAVAESRREENVSLGGQVAEFRIKRDQLLTEQEGLKTRLAESMAILGSERKQGEEKLALISEAKEQLTDRFKTLANDILEEKAKRFTEQNQTNIGHILEPLKVKLNEFQGKVEQVYVQESKDRIALTEQVRQLFDLNQQLSQDANNLAQALKGSSKVQGNWGEVILERILEKSGLRKGHEYDVRESHTREDGSRAQPDVVLHLPQDKHLVLDSKMSLTAYDQYASADDDSRREEALERHVDSVREHIKELSVQDYQTLYGVRSIDFVVMFVPLEPAFAAALAHDSSLCEDAWRKNVLIVSPTTLLFVVRTVAHLWRHEWQNRNVQEIAKRGAELYDKLFGFMEDLNELGKRLDQARTSYDNAYSKFTTGRGNAIRQAENLRALGIKPSKTLPADLLESALDESLSLPEAGGTHGSEPELD